MARYVSRYAQPVYILREDVVEWRSVDHAGERKTIPIQTQKPLIALFRKGFENSFERNFAIACINGKLEFHADGTVSFGDYIQPPVSNAIWGEPHLTADGRLGGAIPNTTPYTQSVGASIIQVGGFDVTEKMSVFDTTWPNWSPEDEREAERLLDAGAGADYWKVTSTRVAPPWPTYEQMRSSQGGTQAVLAHVRNGGYDPAMVLAYEEQAADPKQGIIKGLNEYYQELVTQASEEQALVTRVD